MIEILDLITFFLSTFWLISNFKRIGNNSRFLICALVYVFYIIPLGMDWLYQMANYSYVSDRVGFIWPRHDFLTVLIYDLGMLYTQYYILYGKHKGKEGGRRYIVQTDKNEKLCRLLMFIFMVLPAFATIVLVREPGMLYIMQWRELHLFPDEGSYATIERFAYLGISCSVFILFDKNDKGFFSLKTLIRLMAIAFLYMNICIQGKRAILFYAIINIMVMLYIHLVDLIKSQKNLRRVKRYVIIASVLVLVGSYIMVSITSAVKTERTNGLIDDATMYTTTRIDFFRDDRVRMAIYYSIRPNELSICDFPCQTFIRDFMSFIPLNYVQDKLDWNSASYQTRFTHALCHVDPGVKIDVKEYSFMTVTFFAEMISNLGFLIGIILLPLFCLWFVKMIDKYPYPYNAFIICCFILMNLFDFTYISVVVEFTFILCWLYRKKNKLVLSHNEGINNRAIA